MKKISKYLKRNPAILVVIIGCAIIGVVLILTTHAATPVASVEAESGNIITPASQVSTTGASGGSAVRFNSPSGSSQTTNCAPAAANVLTNTTSHLCGFPDTTNSGVPSGTVLVTVNSSATDPSTCHSPTTCPPSDNRGWHWGGGGITIDSDSAIVDGVRVSGGIGESADWNNITIENSDIGASASGGSIVQVYGPTSGTVIKYSTIHGLDSGSNSAEYAIQDVSDPTLVADHDFLYNCVECYAGGGGTTLSNSYLLVNATEPGAHYEAVYFSGGGLIVNHDTLFNMQNQTAAVDTDPPISRLTIENSLLASGNYLVYAGGSTSTNVAVTNNDIVGSFPNGYLTDYDPEGNWPTSAVWSGNYCDSTGLPVLEEGAYYNIHGADTQQCF